MRRLEGGEDGTAISWLASTGSVPATFALQVEQSTSALWFKDLHFTYMLLCNHLAKEDPVLTLSCVVWFLLWPHLIGLPTYLWPSDMLVLCHIPFCFWTFHMTVSALRTRWLPFVSYSAGPLLLVFSKDSSNLNFLKDILSWLINQVTSSSSHSPMATKHPLCRF